MPDVQEEDVVIRVRLRLGWSRDGPGKTFSSWASCVGYNERGLTMGCAAGSNNREQRDDRNRNRGMLRMGLDNHMRADGLTP